MIRLATSMNVNTASVIRYAYVIALLLILLPQGVIAQRLGAGTTLTGNEPGAPAGSYTLSGFDTVNLYNGNLNFHLPLLQIGGRGTAQHTIMLSIEQRWTMERHVNDIDNLVSYAAIPNNWAPFKPGYGPGVLIGRKVDYQPYGCVNPGGIPGGPVLPAASLTRLSFIAPNGTEYELRDQLYEGRPINYTSCWNHPATSRGKVFRTYDGSAVTFISDADIQDTFYGVMLHIDPSGYLLMPDGTRYRIEDGLVKWIRDRNGNRVTFTYDEFSRVLTITDSLNRVVGIDYYNPPTQAYDRITYTGFGTAQREIRVYKASLSQVLESGSIQTYHELFQPSEPHVPDNNPHNPTVVSEVRLPDNRSYQFRYNSYGELARLTLPTGGVIKYDWEPGPNTYGNGILNGAIVGNNNFNLAVYRRVKQRWVYPDGLTLEGSTKYSADDNSPGGTVVTVDHLTAVNQAPPQSTEKHYFSGAASASLVFGSGPNSELVPTDYPRWNESREYQTEAFGNNGTTVLRRRVDTWQQSSPVSWWLGPPNDAPSNDPRLAETVATLLDVSPNQVSKQSFSYGQYNNRTDAYEYDFSTSSPGALIRHTHTDYKTDGYDTIAGGINNPDATATTHIRSLPSQQIVYDANGIERAKTTYEYDTVTLGGLVDRTGITGLVSRSGQAAGAGYVPTSDLMRGNLTKVTRWLLATTGPGANKPIASYSQYDVAGNVVKTRDPNCVGDPNCNVNGNDTAFDYTDSFSSNFTPNTFAFLKSVTSPNPGATYGGNMPLVSTSVYDFSSGKVVSATDPNGKVTSVEYNDPLDRLTKVIRPAGGGQTRYTYCDGIANPQCPAGEISLRTQTLQSGNEASGVWLEDYALFDGLGRTTRSAHKESASSWSIRENRYDALGRVSQVSNPFFAPNYSAGAGSEWTTSTYDALSRVTQIATPDNALVKTTYLGNQVTVEDQQGKKRSSITDGLGRLIQVNEAPNESAYNYQTNYTYDVLGNLIRVRQGGFPTGGNPDSIVQFRRFYYDSLSRLVYANNPEQNATIAFTPPNEVGALWTMKYEYDDNGNLLKRTDARGVLTTYGYDALNRNTTVDYSNTSISGPDIKRFYDTTPNNGKGRLHKVESYLISPKNASRVDSQTIINNYDNLGRVTSQTQNFLNNGIWTNFSPVTRTYDLASHVTYQANPSGSYQHFQFNAGGRSLHSRGSLGADSKETFYSSETQYNAAGQLTQELLGSSVYHRMDYNIRFQMTEVRIGNHPTTQTSWNLGKLRFFYNSNAKNAENPALDGADNNGNVLRQEHWVPTAVDGMFGVTQYAVPMRDDYFYDPINRLTQVKGWQQTTGAATPAQIYQQTYSYDKFGNRKLYYNVNNPGGDPDRTWGTGINGSLAAHIYDIDKPTNRLAGMLYDQAGNLRASSPKAVEYEDRTYDAENRMTIAQNGSESSYYVYDGDGRRVRRLLSTGDFWQVYGIDGELLAEYQWNGSAATLKKEYGYRDGQLLVVADPTEVTNKKVQWLIADHLGTPRMVVDKTGSLSGVTRHDYLPFGEELMVGMGNGSIRNTTIGYAADSVRQKFTGYERDGESGLDFAKARYYSNVQGRYTGTDPLHSSALPTNPQSWNRYSYVANRPLTLIDPTGLAWGYFSGNAGSWYKWFDDEADIEKNGGTVVKGGPGAFTFQANDGRWIKLDRDSANWKAYSNSDDAFYDGFVVREGEAGSGPGQAVNLALSITGGSILNRAASSFFGRIFGSEITTLGLSSTGTATVASGTGGDIAEMVIVETISKGTSIGSIINRAKELTFSTGNEHALVKLASGERALVSGGSGGISFAEGSITRLYGHTHPFQSLATGASVADRTTIQALGQKSSFLLERGTLSKFTQTTEQVVNRKF
ncbi:MAG: RHS repeat domain-containing protein [Blastocatellia bacterium]